MKEIILQKVKKDYYFLIVLVIALLFFIIYIWGYAGNQNIFNSPDETVNFTFIRLFADQGSLKIYEPLNVPLGGIITPRNATAVGNYIVPASFLGIDLIYGSLAKVLGDGVIIFLTPFFSVIGVLFYYLLVKGVFGRKIAFISSLLMFVLPPFWYYSSRGMFHNVLFINLLIIGLYLFLESIKANLERNKDIFLSGLAGIFIGLALITRTSEFIWVLAILAAVFFFVGRRKAWYNFLTVLFFIGLCFIPVFYFNQQLFGSIFSFGYSQANSLSMSSGSDNYTFLKQVSKLFLPFGIDFSRTAQAVYRYLIIIFPWVSILLFIGLAWFCKEIIFNKLGRYFKEFKKYTKRVTKKQIIYFWLYIFVFIWLLLYYGPYEFNEYFDKSKIILGSSYLRYWLPVYVFGLPFISVGIVKSSQIFRLKKSRRFILVILASGFVIFSALKVLADPLQGIYEVKKAVGRNISQNKIIFNKTSDDSIIVSGFADKILFPERRVIVSFPESIDGLKNNLKILLANNEFYFLENRMDRNAGKTIKSMKQEGFRFEQVYYFVKSNEVLYRVKY